VSGIGKILHCGEQGSSEILDNPVVEEEFIGIDSPGKAGYAHTPGNPIGFTAMRIRTTISIFGKTVIYCFLCIN
jgi:hypothetical protein